MNDKIYFNKKWSKVYNEDNQTYKIIAECEIESLSNQHPYFSITGVIYRKLKNNHWQDESGGCIHKDIIKNFPQLKKFIKWHLTSIDSPMYYIENNLYWLGLRGWMDGKKDSPPKVNYFKHGSIWGECLIDYFIPVFLFIASKNKKINKIKESLIIKILNYRLPHIMEKFDKDMINLFSQDNENISNQYASMLKEWQAVKSN
jgi:hypothetical protein